MSPHTSVAQSAALDCKDVELKVGFRTLLADIQFELGRGQSLALTGPNGLGKTTLLRCLAGISRPHAGQIHVAGLQLWPERQVNFEQGSVLLASQPALLCDHPVDGNLEFMCNSFGWKPTFAQVTKALDRVGLKGREKQVSRTLSTGQKRRLTLAFVLLAKPNLLLADEPTNGLDIEGVELCKQVFGELMSTHGMAVCVASHDERLVQWCHTVLPLESFVPKASAGRRQVQGNILL